MEEYYYFSANVDNHTTLCIAPLTERRLSMSGLHVADTSGYFLYETNRSEEPAEIRLLAHLVSEEAAIQLSRMLNLE